ncbi:MAG: hypothetical protein ACYCXA_05315 [Actinomycetes bacterium]
MTGTAVRPGETSAIDQFSRTPEGTWWPTVSRTASGLLALALPAAWTVPVERSRALALLWVGLVALTVPVVVRALATGPPLVRQVVAWLPASGAATVAGCAALGEASLVALDRPVLPAAAVCALVGLLVTLTVALPEHGGWHLPGLGLGLAVLAGLTFLVGLATVLAGIGWLALVASVVAIVVYRVAAGR